MKDFKNYAPSRDLLKDRVIFVSGSSRGLGKICALCFASYGASVVIHGRNMKHLEQVYDQILTEGGAEPYAISLDFVNASEKDFFTISHEIEKQFGRLDGIVHNAVFLDPLSPLKNKTFASWRRSVDVNLLAPALINKACLPLLEESPDASVIHVSESHANRNAEYWGQYAASKGAMEILTLTQSIETSSTGSLRFNILVPGIIRTPSRQKIFPGELPETQTAPENIMPAFLFLIGPDSRRVNGQKLHAQID